MAEEKTYLELSESDGASHKFYEVMVNGKYVFAGDNCSSIYCFNQAGARLWKLGTGCGSAFSMQLLGDRLYIVSTDGDWVLG